MKNFIKNLVFRLLAGFARVKLKRSKNAKIIGITGSAGKTTVKDAVAKVLSSKYRVIASKKSYNTDFGLPMAILGIDAGFSSAPMWIKNLTKAFWNAFIKRDKVDYFVLEMGVDKPGDMEILLKIVKPHVSVLTNIKPIHLNEGQFKGLDEIFEEKSKIVSNMHPEGYAILNMDDPFVRRLAGLKKPKIIWYGTGENTKVKIGNIKTDLNGTSFDVNHGNVNSRIFMPVIGGHHVSSVLPAIICGFESGMHLDEIKEALANFSLAPGRMNVLEGIKGSTIIDSSYNASPESVIAALDALKEVSGGGRNSGRRKIFIFGNMNELGKRAEEYHKKIGDYATDIIDYFITVGDYAKISAEEAIKNEMPETHVRSFDKSEEAAAYAVDLIKSGDIVLVKGSQNRVRLERLVERIMRHPETAKKVLARQEKIWQKIE